ncbi:hypothetical protein [Actinomycetospora termitidis]|uniref:Uncharacterized protein n=1 Tax=Actinomycetospora termitidis TaxID=3053470 RepID=A0ABT7MEG2_9PSEU|nr:hypothetical protein [Actinomycetospora sp. Odt1-22]MDL5158282.1 hypothetical protein [Actinomycetospora sp. Odt1-22]
MEFGVEHLVGTFFAVLFVVLNAGLLGTVGHVVAVVLALVAAAVVVLAYLRSRAARGSAGMFAMTRAYRVIVTVEVVALVVGIVVCGRLAPQLTVPWIVLVVGVHFLAFARWWPDGTEAAARGGRDGARAFLVIGGVMTVLAVAGGVVGILGGPASQPVAAFVAGFLTGVVMLVGLVVPAVGRLRA